MGEGFMAGAGDHDGGLRASRQSSIHMTLPSFAGEASEFLSWLLGSSNGGAGGL